MEEGRFEIVSPVREVLADHAREPLSVVMMSVSTPEGGVTVDVVDVGTGERPEQYEGHDVRGRAVLIRGTTRPTGFAHAATMAMERGAAGVITDYLLYQTAPFRTRESLPQAVQLLRMPSIHNSAWAIVLDYPAAEHLASLAGEGRARVWVEIRAKSFKGEAQNLLADISGTDKADEFLLFVAHSTAGTRPGANCAAGPALVDVVIDPSGYAAQLAALRD